MDDRRFDRMARGVASAPSRRHFLKGIGAAALAGVAGRVGLGAAAAAKLHSPNALKSPKSLKVLRTCTADRVPCGRAGKCCTAEQTCDSSGLGCVPKGGTGCGGGYCVAAEQTCVGDRGCLPAGGIPCGSGYCASDDFCAEGQAKCVDDCVAARQCGGICCPSGQTCQHGACADPCSEGTCPAPGDVCVEGACSCLVATNCDDGELGNCAGSDSCYCGGTAEGGLVCFVGVSCASLTKCDGSDDCGPNELCLVDSCCGTPVCNPLCGGAVANAREATGGPTSGHK